MQLTKFSKLKIIHATGKKLSAADMLCRSFTKTELQLNQLKHKQFPPQIDFAILQNNSLTLVHYLINMNKDCQIKNMIPSLSVLIMEQINSLSLK